MPNPLVYWQKRWRGAAPSLVLWSQTVLQTARYYTFLRQALLLAGRLLLLLSSPVVVVGQEPKSHPSPYSDLSLEELMNVSVTSVSRKEQRLSDAASAVSVLSNDELRRSGATSVAEALRLVPGMSVGVINSSQWAISSRGFNSLYANKLLVMVDGRAVYSPSFSGVYWDLLQSPLEDLDRIEVIRGPGATIWGANAVNGVINVVSRSARETQGGLIYGGGGSIHQVMGGGRYGGTIGEDTYYRVFGSYQLNSDYPLSTGRDAHDGWQGAQGGFRLDRYLEAGSHLTWQADATVSDLDDHDSSGYGMNTLGRWTRALSERSTLEVQSYFDRYRRNELTRALSVLNTADITAQHTLELSDRHSLISGMGYRFVDASYASTTPLLEIREANTQLQVFNAFVQDEFQLLPDRLTLTAGTKLEHNDYTGFEVQPSVRLLFKPDASQSVWLAASRATRTPSVLEGGNSLAVMYGSPFIGPGGFSYVPTLVGNSQVQSEILWAYELGYRLQISKSLSLDSALFFNRYSQIIAIGDAMNFVAGAPVGLAEIPWANSVSGKTYGGEVAVTWAPRDDLRLIGSYSLLLADLQGPAASSPATLERSAPKHRAILRAAYDLDSRLTFDAQVRFEDSLESVPSYLTADVRVAYRISDRLEVSLVGQNLLENRHPEQPPAAFAITSEAPRAVYGKVTWRF